MSWSRQAICTLALLGKLPVLGWSSWNAYQHDISEAKIFGAAQAMNDTGLKAAGYTYVNIDDSWAMNKRVKGHIVPDRTRFPDGIDGLAKKIHDLKMKIGIYSDAGTAMCGGDPGSLDHEKTDAGDWASWEIDYLKYDNCHSAGRSGRDRYSRMRDALASQTRPILLNICIWGKENVVTWGNDIGISWRVTDDIRPRWSGSNNGRDKYSIMYILNTNSKLMDHVNFWGHNDADSLEIGNVFNGWSLSPAEERSHFALWAAMKSPLIIGTDISRLKSERLDLLKNKYLLAFNQDDVFGAPAKPYKREDGRPWKTTSDDVHPVDYWSGESKDGFLVLMLNTLDKTVKKTAKWSEIPGLGGKSYKVTDVWTGKDLGCLDEYTADVESHDTAAILVSKETCVSRSLVFI
ncbi:alpha-galactosidase [Pochonia chlamydosporia 170]|uniref:Alpha-galactosidase n=1 Tax=Pochonia chlamydosporia 170 TaxID=1380566 RepID=A0A179FDR2_METCM|nr:alpha-galactosidase [Pochonia chlamydosporia 170]OAQ63715.1 alpha-galactosidase [Pochonia chlamydosporia 170]